MQKQKRRPKKLRRLNCSKGTIIAHLSDSTERWFGRRSCFVCFHLQMQKEYLKMVDRIYKFTREVEGKTQKVSVSKRQKEGK